MEIIYFHSIYYSKERFNMPMIVHFDIPADDIDRAKKFYKDLFDWEIEEVPDLMEYYEISTKNEEGKEGVAGSIGKREQPGAEIINYIGISSIDIYIEKAKKLGAKIIMPKTTIPRFGYLAVFLDTENNSLGIWETDSNAQM
jgi:predicted enzyme related to lactoylglutathione lyase